MGVPLQHHEPCLEKITQSFLTLCSKHKREHIMFDPFLSSRGQCPCKYNNPSEESKLP